MNSLQHPEKLNTFQAYRQARQVASSTTRAKNPDWYRAAHQVNLQWHIRSTGSPRLASAVFSADNETWSTGPKLNLPQLRSIDALQAAVDEILEKHPKAKSLGIVLHIADEFATTEIFEDFSDWDQLADLSQRLTTNPHALLGDDAMVTEDTSWRIIPTPGAITPPICTTVAISHRYQEVLANFREIGERRNFPILTEGVSAPLAFLALLPAFVDFSVEEPQLIVLHYHKFSALAIFNAQGELIKLRALPHRGRPHPPNLSDTLTGAIHANELQKARIVLVPMTSTDIDPLVTQLHATLHLEEEPLIDVIKPGVESVTNCSGSRPEMLFAQPAYASSDASTTFQMLGAQAWAFQDFLSAPASETDAIPSWKDLQLLKTSKLLKPILALVCIGVLGVSAMSAISAMNQESWRHDDGATASLRGMRSQLTKTETKFNHWDNLLSDRSSAWSTMELIARMFPGDSGVLVDNVSYKANAEQAKKGNALPLTREWVISGTATDDGGKLLQSLNSREGVYQLFKNVSQATGIDSLDPTLETRQLLVNIQQSNNTRWKQSASVTAPLTAESCPLRFNMKVTMRYTQEDPLAVTKNAQPK